MGRRLMGLYDVTSVGGFPGWDIMTIWASFHWIGKWQRRNMLLYIYVVSRMGFLGRFFSIVATIVSCLGALCRLSRFIAFLFQQVWMLWLVVIADKRHLSRLLRLNRCCY
jgi:hypothetical protein